jgi:uncharacterized protein involved in type VI secretion and phage assembly
MDQLLAGATDEAEREANGFLAGVAVGIVTDNKDPDGLARVRVRLPWQAEGDTSFWARIAMPMAGNDRGTYFLPEIDDEVLVAGESGDPSHLYVVGTLWNGRAMPPTANADGKNHERLIKSRSGHHLRFVDDPAAPEIDLALVDGKRLRLDNDGIVVEDGSGNSVTISSSSGAIEISASTSIDVKAPKVSVKADGSMEIRAGGTLTLTGAMVQIN